MNLQSIATVTPDHYYTQAEWGAAMQRHLAPSDNHEMKMLAASCATASSIRGRWLATDSLDKLAGREPDRLNYNNTLHSIDLGVRAVNAALQKAGVEPGEVDALLVATSTGFLSPGLTSRIARRFQFRDDVIYQDFIGMGCSAALSMWRTAECLLATSCQKVLCVSVEVCSSCFSTMDASRLLLSGLFGDSASATLWSAYDEGLVCGKFKSVTYPDRWDTIQVEMVYNRFLPVVSPRFLSTVKAVAARYAGIYSKVISHSGGEMVLKEMEGIFPELAPEVRQILQEYGNLSSNSVVFALEKALQSGPPAGDEEWLLLTFGSGLNVTSCALQNVQN